MISTKRAAKIILETDAEKRGKMIDKLTEEDAKYLLKKCLDTIINDTPLSQSN